MEYRYSITPAGNFNMSVRPKIGVDNSPIGQLSAGTRGYGDILEVLPDGGKWLYVVQGALNKGTTVMGWVAIEHNGKTYCTLIDHDPDTPTDPTPPADDKVVKVVLYWESGKVEELP